MSLLWKPWVHMTHSCNDGDAPLPIRPYLHVIVLQLATSNTTHSLHNLLQLPASEGLVTMTTWIFKAVVLTLSQVHSCIACKTTFEFIFNHVCRVRGENPKGSFARGVSLILETSWSQKVRGYDACGNKQDAVVRATALSLPPHMQDYRCCIECIKEG